MIYPISNGMIRFRELSYLDKVDLTSFYAVGVARKKFTWGGSRVYANRNLGLTIEIPVETFCRCHLRT
jgi:hypothetical protein